MSVVTYTNDPIPDQPILDKGTITSAITVDDSYYAADVNVTVNMSHTRDEDLDVFLIAPDGTRVELFTDVGGTGDHFNGTTLDAGAATAITAGSAPFSGTYRPEGNLSTLERKSVQGTWKLEVTDDTRKETGTLNSWSLMVTEAIGVSTRFLDTNPEMLGNVSMRSFGSNAVAMSENGDAMAVWIESQGLGDTGPFMTMAAQYDAATGAWSSTEIISDPTLTEPVRSNLVANCHIAGDGQGNYLAVWEQATAGEGSLGLGSIWANRYVAGVGWQGPETLEEEVSPVCSSLPVVAMAYDPMTHVSKGVVAWSYHQSTSGPWDVKVNLLTDFSANTWSGASLAENLSVSISGYGLGVAMATSGDFLLTFKDANSATGLNPVPADAYYRHYKWSTGWTSDESLLLESRPEDVTYPPELAMNAAGEAIVSWTQQTGTAGGRQLWARRWTGSGWASDAELLSDDPYGTAIGTSSPVKVAISDNGEAAVLYPQMKESMPYRDVYVFCYAGGQWQGSVKLDWEDLGNMYYSGAGIAMDDAGNGLAVWRQSDGVFQNLWSAKFDRSTSTWSPAVKLENAPYDVAGSIAVGMNGSGVATTVWVQPDNTLTHVYASRTTVGGASLPTNQVPVAAAGGSYVGSENAAVSFDASGSYDTDGTVMSYTWDFGDGTAPITVGAATISHEYLWGGAFDVVLTVRDDRGGTATDHATASITEVNDAPVADPGDPYGGTVDVAIAFDGSGSYDFDNQDGTAANNQSLSYQWDFGDGSTASGVTASHAYAAVGTYTASLTVSDGSVTDTQTTTVTVQAATSSISYDYTGLPVTIGDLKTVTTTINVPDTNPITEIQVRLNLTHANPADLTAWLVSPNEITMAINGPIVSGSQVYDVTYPSGMDVGDLEPFGTWTLSIRDGVRNSKRGTFTDWSLLVTPAPGSGASMPQSTATDVDQALLSWLEPDSSDEEESDLLPQPAATDLALMMME